MTADPFALTDDLLGALAAMTGLVGSAEFHPQPPSADVTALDLIAMGAASLWLSGRGYTPSHARTSASAEP